MPIPEHIQKAISVCECNRQAGFACSEASFLALSEIYNVLLSDQVKRSVSAFSGGATEDGRCGVLEAGLAFASIAFPNMSNQELLEWSKRMHHVFQEHLGGVHCSDLFYPLHKQHHASGSPEADFTCVFHSGVCAVATVLDEIKEATSC